MTLVLANRDSILSDFNEFVSLTTPKINGSKLPIILSFAFELPQIQFVKTISSNMLVNKDYFYWKIKHEEIEFLAAEPLINFNEYGEKRLLKTSDKISIYENKFISNWEKKDLEFVPLIVGGIKFAPDQHSQLWKDFSDSDWFIPKMVFYRQNNSIYFIYNFFHSVHERVKNEDFPEILCNLEKLYSETAPAYPQPDLIDEKKSNAFDPWKRIVDEAISSISGGLLSKVVLSRQVKYNFKAELFLPALLEKLSSRYPACYTFAYKRNGSVFFGASPEKLAKISDNWIEVDALAGSVPRGRNEAEDLEYEKFLLSSEKNLFEQRAVVNFIHNLLSKFSDEIIFEDKPRIRKLPNIQHLWTVIKARLQEDIRVLDLLMKVHPTPAICGDPWKTAKDFILEIESHDRGLYSGNIGWFNFNGSGEFAVGIRTALIKKNSLYAYAGCGIVEGSEAEAEFDESEIKLKPITSLFIDE